MRIRIKNLVSATAAVAMVMGGGLFSQTLAVPLVGGTVDPTTIPKYVTPLVIPPVMPASIPRGTPGTEDYNIAVRQFQQQILPGGIWNAAGGYAPGTYTFPPTTVWSYGNADDPMPDSSGALGGGVGVAPAPNSSFNYPAFTVENTSGVMTKVRWINELVKDPMACFYGALGDGTECNYLSHLLPVDQTLHWANPPNTGCIGMMAMPDGSGTDCETLNDLSYTGPVPIVTHVHGADVNQESDGYPNAWWLPAANNIPAGVGGGPGYATLGNMFSEWTVDGANNVPGSAFYAYENTQPAATIWYHDHSMGMTRLNVYAGPAGFWLIRGGVNDTAANVLPGPAPVAGDATVALNVVGDAKRNSIREIPIAIQDRSFDWVDATGAVVASPTGAVGTKLWYPTSRTDFDGFAGPYINPDPLIPSDISGIWNPEAFFNTFVVNGVTWPSLKVAQEQYRFRLLSGSNSRTLNLSLREVTGAGTDTIFGTADDTLGVEYPFYLIGGDQGFLPKVVMIQTGSATQLPGDGTIPTTLTPLPSTMQGLLMMPAERADVIVDFTGIPTGTRIRMLNTADDAPFGGLDPLAVADPGTTGQVMEFMVDNTINQVGGDPSTPVASLSLPFEAALGPESNTRKISLNEMESESVCIEIDAVTGAYVGTLFNQPVGDPNFLATCLATIPPAGTTMSVPVAPRQALLGDVMTDPITGGLVAVPNRFQDPISENPLVNTTEIWEIYNTTMDAHPIHVHLVRFQVVNREDMSINFATGVMTPLGTTHNPLPTELGYKDTVVAYPDQITRVKATFSRVGLYLWHCHIVEHEDNEMMLPYKVMGLQAAAPATLGATLTPTGNVDLVAAVSTTPGVNYVFEYMNLAAPNWIQKNTGTVNTTTITGLVPGSYAFRVKVIEPNITPTTGTYADSAWTAGPVVAVTPIVASTVGVYRPSDQKWYLDKNGNGVWNNQPPDKLVSTFSLPTDVQIVGDWNGDGISDLGFYRAGFWYLDMNNNGIWDGIPNDKLLGKFGQSTDIPVVGDWNGDGISEVGVYRAGYWYLDVNGNGIWNNAPNDKLLGKYGQPTDTPVVGDWNGDGISEIGVYRAGYWYLDVNGNGIWNNAPNDKLLGKFGQPTDKPVVGDWNADGISNLGIYRDGYWYLDVNGNGIWNNAPNDKLLGKYGQPTDIPLVGKW